MRHYDFSHINTGNNQFITSENTHQPLKPGYQVTLIVFSFQIDAMLSSTYLGSIKCCVYVMILWPVCRMQKAILHLNLHLKGSLVTLIKLGLLTYSYLFLSYFSLLHE